MSISPVVQNVVSFGKLEIEGNSKIELSLIAEKVSGSRYNKKRFPAVILRKTKPKSTILIFQSGKIILIGSQSQQDAQINAKRLTKQIQKLINKKIKLVEFRITNIVANANLGYKINVTKFVQSQKYTVLKDDQFPGAICKMGTPVKAVLVFSSGRVIFTGTNERMKIQKAFQILLEDLKEFCLTKNQ